MKLLNEVLQDAQEGGYAVGHFNFASLGQLYGIIDAAVAKKAPVILGTSEGEAEFIGMDVAIVLRDVLRERTGLPIYLNLDHGSSSEKILEAATMGYDSVHFDGSKVTDDIEKNISQTKELCNKVRAINDSISFEGEVSALPTESSQVYDEEINVDSALFTQPEDAKRFVEETGVDRLAAAFGTLHGVIKGGRNPSIDLELLGRIGEATGAYLVLHGGSGTPEKDLRLACEGPITKLHISTEIRIAFAGALREILQDEKQIKPYSFLLPAIEAVKEVVEHAIDLSGSEGRAVGGC